MVSKKSYRTKAHAGSFKKEGMERPLSPRHVDWSKYFRNTKKPDYLDLGCGYGKFLLRTADKCKKNILGIEIRNKVYEYTKRRIEKSGMENVGVMNTNGLLFLPNIFEKKSLEKIFILFPDPHFKKTKQKGRIVGKRTMGVFEYLLKDGGRLYISTDVKSLYDDMCGVIEESGFFEEKEKAKTAVTKELLENQEKKALFEATYLGTDKSTRAGVKNGMVYASVYVVKKK
ncbi:TRMB [Enterospora canceri]|uniref:tRNA (guanine-N(7)-)-methyltransferase n=1 Tax=Enterospora canceri TaxID=1081671 RepID=A0A1Y1S961_9MICR|nr:TRMB [Enterospora canceri]